MEAGEWDLLLDGSWGVGSTVRWELGSGVLLDGSWGVVYC